MEQRPLEFLVLRRIWPILGSVYVVFRFAGFLQFSFWFSFLSTIFGGLSDFVFFCPIAFFRFPEFAKELHPVFSILQVLAMTISRHLRP